jgi:hypothetical protein
MGCMPDATKPGSVPHNRIFRHSVFHSRFAVDPLAIRLDPGMSLLLVALLKPVVPSHSVAGASLYAPPSRD